MFKLYRVVLKSNDVKIVVAENLSMVAGVQYLDRRTYEVSEVSEVSIQGSVDFVLATPQTSPVVDPPLSIMTKENPYLEVVDEFARRGDGAQAPANKIVDQEIANVKIKQDAEQEQKYFDWLAENLAKRGFAVPQADGGVELPEDFGVVSYTPGKTV